MTRVITRPLKEDKDGIPGYIAFPEREEKGPGLLLIHQHSGLTGYLKTAAYRFASWVTPQSFRICITCWVIRRKRTSTKAPKFKTRHRTRILFESSTRAGVMFVPAMM